MAAVTRRALKPRRRSSTVIATRSNCVVVTAASLSPAVKKLSSRGSSAMVTRPPSRKRRAGRYDAWVPARERYRELCGKVDAFFARVKARHPVDMNCAAGCDGCCRIRLTVTMVEAEEIREAVAALSPEARQRAAARARLDAPDRCAALEEDGRCAIYAARPLLCRSHGLPVRMVSERGLPVVDACVLNFTERGPAEADPDCILDQANLSLTLGAIARAHATETGGDADERVEIAELLGR
jgi:hypothetical protein